ncbi:hypothetical protein E1A91_A10G058900v1 [Gossypium mustelinum]|uniref:Secreted protein n=4 Tax=Gossypium TaxID=3633 RepID=A0A5J5U336_GOSBA|nr:hypothetical protein ES319_A10G057600v1 [Gossypium barbadense]TYG97735.1 hypothetical protein ES288_A10G061600v1 [Gossypium darwinii]TYI05068.1 hypothetical protein ES332_A10G061900v1 [Gossypium tomentosum]TYJ13546.1 hypothetical protein E1A91_A10G058900v1 [Gossypium mustelinum]
MTSSLFLSLLPLCVVFLCQKHRFQAVRWRHVACHQHPPWPYGQRVGPPRVNYADDGFGWIWNSDGKRSPS